MCKNDKILIASNWYLASLVKNIKKYLLAALFNAPSTMNGYYQAEVNHDMPGLVR